MDSDRNREGQNRFIYYKFWGWDNQSLEQILLMFIWSRYQKDWWLQIDVQDNSGQENNRQVQLRS